LDMNVCLNPWYLLNRRLELHHSWVWCLGKEKNFLPFLSMKPWFHRYPACCVVAILTELSWHMMNGQLHDWCTHLYGSNFITNNYFLKNCFGWICYFAVCAENIVLFILNSCKVESVVCIMKFVIILCNSVTEFCTLSL
jgi:hypothetical protein